MDVPVLTGEVFLVLKRYLPTGTYISSAYRSPAHQLSVIRDMANAHNSNPKNKASKISVPAAMSVDDARTWLPVLRALRAQHYAVNAPTEVRHGGKVEFKSSPHSAYRVVFDLAHREKTLDKLREIKEGCATAERRRVVKFNQVKVEPKAAQMAVHVDVMWVSSRALDQLWTEMGFAVA